MGPLAMDTSPRGFLLPRHVLILPRGSNRTCSCRRGLIRVGGGVLVLASSLGRGRWGSRGCGSRSCRRSTRSEEHTSELQSRLHLVCRLLLEKKKELWIAPNFQKLSPCGVPSALTASLSSAFSFFFNDTATTEIYTLSLHDALPISVLPQVN